MWRTREINSCHAAWPLKPRCEPQHINQTAWNPESESSLIKSRLFPRKDVARRGHVGRGRSI